MGAGRVRHLGLSNFPLRLVEEVLSWAAVKPVVNQVETQPLLAQRKLIGVCLRKVGWAVFEQAGAAGWRLCEQAAAAATAERLPASASPPTIWPRSAGRTDGGLQPAGPQRPRAAHSPHGAGGGGGGGQDARAGAARRGRRVLCLASSCSSLCAHRCLPPPDPSPSPSSLSLPIIPSQPHQSQVLLKWNVQRGVAVIPKAGSAAHVAENAEGLFTWRLTWDQKASFRFCLQRAACSWCPAFTARAQQPAPNTEPTKTASQPTACPPQPYRPSWMRSTAGAASSTSPPTGTRGKTPRRAAPPSPLWSSSEASSEAAERGCSWRLSSRKHAAVGRMPRTPAPRLPSHRSLPVSLVE